MLVEAMEVISKYTMRTSGTQQKKNKGIQQKVRKRIIIDGLDVYIVEDEHADMAWNGEQMMREKKAKLTTAVDSAMELDEFSMSLPTANARLLHSSATAIE